MAGITTDVLLTGPVQSVWISDWSGNYNVQAQFKFHIVEVVNESDNSSTLTITAFCKSGPNRDPNGDVIGSYRGWFTGTVFYQMDGSSTEVVLANWSESAGNAGLPDRSAADSEGWRSIGSGGTDTMPWTPWSTTVTVPHNADGTLSLKLGFKANGGTNPTLLIQNGTAYVGVYNFNASATTDSVVLTPIAVGGFVYISDGSAFGKYRPYVWTGSAWVPADPYVWNGSRWVPCA